MRDFVVLSTVFSCQCPLRGDSDSALVLGMDEFVGTYSFHYRGMIIVMTVDMYRMQAGLVNMDIPRMFGT